MSKRIVLFTLQTFSTTGGIQKMTRTLANSLQKITTTYNWDFKLWSVYDKDQDLMPQYLSPEKFKGFNVKHNAFVLKATKVVNSADVIIISHVNLAIIGLIAKLINPKCQLWLIAHGIEVWRPLSRARKMFLKKCDKIVCVSDFTRQEMISNHGVSPDKCVVLNNALDPFMTPPANFKKPGHLQQKYKLDDNDIILFTLTRLAITEQYKGYEQVIKVLARLKTKIPSLKYILSGQYDAQEGARIKQMLKQHQVEDMVILTGFVAEKELTDHFLLADLFVLPSKKEGFGIVFIEALSCGLPVICGNVDGSLDAIRNGELGKAINPDNLDELETALALYLQKPLTIQARQDLQQRCLQHFNQDNYINKLQQLLINEPAS
jgi:phosphatidylinositol alpha-1,6-mannosyltransferase